MRSQQITLIFKMPKKKYIQKNIPHRENKWIRIGVYRAHCTYQSQTKSKEEELCAHLIFDKTLAFFCVIVLLLFLISFISFTSFKNFAWTVSIKTESLSSHRIEWYLCCVNTHRLILFLHRFPFFFVFEFRNCILFFYASLRVVFAPFLPVSFYFLLEL